MKKISKIIIIFLILLCTLIPSCFAIDFTYEGNNYTFSSSVDTYLDTYPYMVFVYNPNEGYKYRIYFSNSPAVISNTYNPNTVGANQFMFLPSRSARWYVSTTLTPFYSPNTFSIRSDTTNGFNLPSGGVVIYTNHDIVDGTGSVIFSNMDVPAFVAPSILNTQEDLKTGNFNNIEIAPNDYLEPFYLHVAEISRPVAEDTSIIYYTNQKTFYLGSDVSYYVPTGNLYSVPKSELGFTIETGKEYIFAISSNSSSLPNISEEEIFQKVEVIAEERSENAILNDKIDIQNETSKGMWETLKDILSYINPFSENFFVYKLIEMLVEALKSLFIPQDGFLGTYFEELKNWFSDRLGFLFYPFELLIDILNQILGINFSEPVFDIPDINEPFTNTKLISATTFNFNSLLENNVLKTIHDIYLICLDAFIVFELVNLFRRKYEEVTTK